MLLVQKRQILPVKPSLSAVGLAKAGRTQSNPVAPIAPGRTAVPARPNPARRLVHRSFSGDGRPCEEECGSSRAVQSVLICGLSPVQPSRTGRTQSHQSNRPPGHPIPARRLVHRSFSGDGRPCEGGCGSSPVKPSRTGQVDHLVPMPTFCTVWKSLPSVLMLGAMMISVS